MNVSGHVRWRIGLSGAIVVLFAVFVGLALYTPGLLAASSDSEAAGAKHVRFLIAHQPVGVFEEANEVFKQELNWLSDGSMTLEVLTPADFDAADRDLTREEVEALFDEGRVDVSSVPVASFSSDAPLANVFDLPYLFSGYDTLSSFFASESGQQVLAEITEETGGRALAYTFSGGFYFFGMFDADTEVSGARVVSSGGDMAQATLEALGAEPVSPEAYRSNPDADGVEATYTRVSALEEVSTIQAIVEPGHRVLVTTLVANDTFYDSLSAQQQDVLQEAAKRAAEVERDTSITRAEEVRGELLDQGVVIERFSDERRARLRDTHSDTYKEFAATAGDGFLETLLEQ